MGEVLESTKGQLGFDLGDTKPIVAYEPDRDEIRSELAAVLETARAASAPPWDERTLRYHKVVFPQMARWLPDDERQDLCAAFVKEVARFDALDHR